VARLAAAPTDSRELERLLLRMSGKDEVAFTRLYAATKRKLFSAVLSIVRRRHLAEEAVQEVYVRIWLNAASYRPALGSPMLWMISIARNLAIDIARKSVREICSDESSLARFPSDCPDALQAIEIREDEKNEINRQRSVFSALEALDPTRRHLVIAAYLHGESRSRLSERYGVPVNTIKTWIRRALLEARASLQDGPVHATAQPGRLEDSPIVICLNG
jgi:RNA polymerase sigma-70 factor (ECF subfamily)